MKVLPGLLFMIQDDHECINRVGELEGSGIVIAKQTKLHCWLGNKHQQ